MSSQKKKKRWKKNEFIERAGATKHHNTVGCINSKEDEGLRDSQSSALLVPLPRTSTKSPLSDKEIESRIECPHEAIVMKIGPVVYNVAYVCQRGYYPDSPGKENQDTFSVIPKFDNFDAGFFGVYDGHGKEGHLCSRYIRDRLPNAIANAVSNLAKPTTENIKRSLHNTHIRVNRNLHESRVDDSLSGTTSISMLMIGRTMYISNVGDSRAIIVSMEDGKLKAHPLSSDQTPYRKDERERVKKYGARVMSMDQIEGVEPIHENWGDINLGEEIDEGGDPPRIWSPHGAYPGTAFTRSFGDMYAEELGVTAEPEILVRDIQPNDRFIVIASDGVFEFLTNQMVADMIAQRPDPLDACRAVVAQSYELWLQYEVRTDDITIIAIYIQSGQDLIEKTTDVSTQDIQLMEEITNRPVRRAVSREKRKILIQAAEDTRSMSRIESDRHLLTTKIPKTPEEIDAILMTISDNFLFHHLSNAQRLSLVESMHKVNVKAGDWIIKQGDAGDRFYIIESGKYEVRVKQPSQQSQPNSEEAEEEGDDADSFGAVVHVYESGPNQHPCFGELALMYGKPRAASVIARMDGSLWTLDRFIFVNSVLRTQTVRKDILRVLRKVELLKSLNTVQLQRLVDLMSEVQYQTGDMIIKQGDPGETFYVIVSGTCSVTIQDAASGEVKEVAKLGSHSFFGERALLTSEPRAATITALSEVSLLQIGRRGFEEVLGQLSEIIEANQLNKTVKSRIVAEKQQTSSSQIPQKMADIQINGSVSTDKFGSICLGTFQSTKPNLSIKSFLLNAKAAQMLSHEISNCKEAANIIESSSTPLDHFIPLLLTSFRTSNGFHMIYDTAVIATIESLYQSDGSHLPLLPYVVANIINGLEFLHKVGIVYRSIQPEAIHLTSQGKIVLMDYSICKIGGVGRETFTLCGVPDYLSPEQVSQRGHNEAVDFWSLGVLLYELTTHTNPFSQDNNGELAIFSKITSYGTSTFPQLAFPAIIPATLSSLITELLNPSPMERLGVGSDGFTRLRQHKYFTSLSSSSFSSQTSSIQNLVKEMEEFILSESAEVTEITSQWNKVVAGTEYIDDILKED